MVVAGYTWTQRTEQQRTLWTIFSCEKLSLPAELVAGQMGYIVAYSLWILFYFIKTTYIKAGSYTDFASVQGVSPLYEG